MPRNPLFLLPLAGLLLLTGCPEPPADDDDDDSAPVTDDDDAVELPYVVEMEPADGDADFFYQDDMRVRFSLPVDEFAYTVTGPDGEVPVDLELGADRLEVTIDPLDDLLPSTPYQVHMTWSPAASDEGYAFSFSTGLSGLEVDPTALVQTVFLVDLAEGTWTQPAGVGAFVATQLGDWVLLMQVLEQSQLALEDHPGMHILGAGAERPTDGGIVQSDCQAALRMTAGPDQLLDTDDDVPGTLANPEFDFGPTRLEMMVNGNRVRIDQTRVGGLFELDLASITGLSIAGVLDTRALDGMLGEPAEEGAVCELVWETAEIPCEECGDPPGLFCLDVEVVDIPTVAVADVVIADRTCADVIGAFVADGSCDSEAAAYDPAGDGSYADCPLWSTR